MAGVEAALKAAKTAVDAIRTDAQMTTQEKAAAVIGKIEAIGTVTLQSEQAIREARRDYDALSDEAKGLVTNAGLLAEAEETLKALKKEEAALVPENPSTGEAADCYAVMLLAGMALACCLTAKKEKSQ